MISRTLINQIQELKKDYKNNYSQINSILGKCFFKGINGFPKDLIQAKKHYLRVIIPLQKDIDNETDPMDKIYKSTLLNGSEYCCHLKIINAELDKINVVDFLMKASFSNPLSNLASSNSPSPLLKYEADLKKIEEEIGVISTLEEAVMNPSLVYLCQRKILNSMRLFSARDKLPEDLQQELQSENMIIRPICK